MTVTAETTLRAPATPAPSHLAGLDLYGRRVASRMILGTALYPSPSVLAASVKASGAGIVTVSLRREAARGATGDSFMALVRDMPIQAESGRLLLIMLQRGIDEAGDARVVEIGGKTLALYNVEGKFYSMDNTCVHRGGPLGEGFLDGTIVTCPWHGWQYDLTTGTLIQDPRVGVSRHETRSVGDEVQVRLTD